MTQFRQEIMPADQHFPAWLTEQAAAGWDVIGVTMLGQVPAKVPSVMVSNQQVHPAIPVMYVLFRNRSGVEMIAADG